jgi:hypothetical protein
MMKKNKKNFNADEVLKRTDEETQLELLDMLMVMYPDELEAALDVYNGDDPFLRRLARSVE